MKKILEKIIDWCDRHYREYPENGYYVQRNALLVEIKYTALYVWHELNKGHVTPQAIKPRKYKNGGIIPGHKDGDMEIKIAGDSFMDRDLFNKLFKIK